MYLLKIGLSLGVLYSAIKSPRLVLRIPGCVTNWLDNRIKDIKKNSNLHCIYTGTQRGVVLDALYSCTKPINTQPGDRQVLFYAPIPPTVKTSSPSRYNRAVNTKLGQRCQIYDLVLEMTIDQATVSATYVDRSQSIPQEF